MTSGFGHGRHMPPIWPGPTCSLGVASAGIAMVEGHPVHIADTAIDGPVLLTIRPTAIALFRRPPEGSPRNTWNTVVDDIEDLGDRARVRTGGPLPLTAEVTTEAVSDLGLVEGSAVVVSIKATEILVMPDAETGALH